MSVDLQLFRKILSVDSTSGRERELTALLKSELSAPVMESFPVGDGTENLLLSWGTPRLVFCTHQDTVPPYIAPTIQGETPDDVVYGRGACDAKGQIISMYTACKQLEANGLEGFGLLLLTGEETGSWGAKAFSKTGFRAPYLVIGEPTENKMVSASKGTKAFELRFTGEAFHSGYPQYGRSAVDAFVDFVNALRAVEFPKDPVLGDTTWNIGRLVSDNPQNVLSPELRCRLYFRTTFASDAFVSACPARLQEPGLAATAIGGDAPAEYFTLDGFETAPVAFGSDAPHLTGFEHKMIMGPGSIRHAHRDDEQILIRDMEDAVCNYVRIAGLLLR